MNAQVLPSMTEALKVSKLGLKDQPIEDPDDEALGVDEYAEVLTEFIKKCDTPITIALQGDWGTGKTSLMTLIKSNLAKPEEDGRFLSVWFNTWQYSQFSMSDTLALSMMSKIAQKLDEGTSSGPFQSFKKNLWAVTRAVAIGGASIVGQGDPMREAVSEAEKSISESESEDSAGALERIKESLVELVEQKLTGNIEKLVIFVDDLDRLIPEKAVELLEAMKVFLDIDRCVYVIACDYSVVAAGLKAKFGLSESELKGKSFFDKIIQVPFKMPVRRYRVDTYIESLLKKIGIDLIKGKDVDIYRDLVDYSVGFNPRTMKRFLNTLQLLMILENKRRKVTHVDDELNNENVDRQRYVCRVTFAILCMIEKYECIYEYLTSDLTEARLMALRDGIAEDDEYVDLRQELEETHGVDNISLVHDFLCTFIECIDLDEDEHISEAEMDHLNDMLSQTALVSSSHTVSQIDPREFAADLKRELNSKYRHYFRSNTKWRYSKFFMRYGSVYMNCDRGGLIQYELYLEDDIYYLDVYSDGDYSVRLGEIICEKFGIEGELWPVEELDAAHHFVFIKQDAKEEDALRKFKTAVYEHFDKVTSEQRFLFDSCGRVLSMRE